MGDLSKDFSRWEFADPSTSPLRRTDGRGVFVVEEEAVDPNLVIMLQKARDLSGKPIHISSGLRSPGHNASIGGSPESSHLKGLAADIICRSSTERFELIAALHEAGFRRIGVYPQHIHVDIDESKIQDILFLGK